MILEAIFRRLRNNEIDLDTFFQRKQDLWNTIQKSRLIESILIRLPLPAFYFDGSDDDKWLVVDGLQRLSVFKKYIIEKDFKLQGLEFLTRFENHGFDELPRDLRRRIEEHEITVYIINPGTPEQVKFNLFRRINTGGLILSAQEIRNALNQGIPADFINELSEIDEFKKYGIKQKRMLDRDFVTRFVAFYIRPIKEYKQDLDSFLNDSMKKLKDTPVKTREKLKADFKKALILAWKNFETDAFRKKYSSDEKRKNPINKSLFEAWTINLYKIEDNKIETIISRKEDIKREFISLLNNDKKFEQSITGSTGQKKNIERRFQKIEQLIKRVLND